MSSNRLMALKTTLVAENQFPFSQKGKNLHFNGVILVILSGLLFSGLDATAKYLSTSLPILEIVWLRFVCHVLLSLILFRIWKNPFLFKTKRLGHHIIRTFCLLGGTVFNFLALRHLKMAETMSIMFAAPLVITALAGPMLGESAGLRRWAAIIVGFVGLLIIARPDSGNMQSAAIYAVIAMLLNAFYALLTRKMTATENPVRMLIISGTIAAVFMTPIGLSVWAVPEDAWTWTLLLLTGVLGASAHYVFTIAYQMSPASLLAPFSYTKIIWMTALGYLIFSNIPDINTIVGAAIIIGSGMYILKNERHKTAL